VDPSTSTRVSRARARSRDDEAPIGLLCAVSSRSPIPDEKVRAMTESHDDEGADANTARSGQVGRDDEPDRGEASPRGSPPSSSRHLDAAFVVAPHLPAAGGVRICTLVVVASVIARTFSSGIGERELTAQSKPIGASSSRERARARLTRVEVEGIHRPGARKAPSAPRVKVRGEACGGQ